MGRNRAEVGANERGFEIVESGSIDLFADGNNVFDAFGQVLARRETASFMRSIKLGFCTSSRLPKRV